MDRKSRKVLLLTLVLCALAVTGAVGQPEPNAANQPGTLFLDLATMPPGEVQTRPGGRNATYDRIVIFNAIPRFWPYDIDIEIKEVGIPPLSLAGFPSPPARDAGSPSVAEDTCLTPIADLEDKLDKVEKERRSGNRCCGESGRGWHRLQKQGLEEVYRPDAIRDRLEGFCEVK